MELNPEKGHIEKFYKPKYGDCPTKGYSYRTHQYAERGVSLQKAIEKSFVS